MSFYRVWLLARVPPLKLYLAHARKGMLFKRSRRRGWRVFWPLGLAAPRKEGFMPGTDHYTEDYDGRDEEDGYKDSEEREAHAEREALAEDGEHNGHGKRRHYCFTGSTHFYDTPATDEYTPSYLEAGLLEFNVGTRRDGTIPSWIDPDSKKSPIVQYVEWFNGIWHTGDPTLWNETVFTNTTVIIDPTGVSKGAKNAANSFLLLFKYYPELRGEVVSWAANNREILINWRFRVKQRDGGTELLVPVVDKFCFRDGRVSHRLAFFDILTFIGYLTDNYGQGQLTDYLKAAIENAEATGGIQNVPRLIWRTIKGLFVWPDDAEMYGLRATAGDGVVRLTWNRAKDAVSYKINRSTDLNGPFEPPPNGSGGVNPSEVTPANPDDARVTYYDTEVTNGVTYWYIVSPNYQQWKPAPVLPEHRLPSGLRFPRRRRREIPYGVSRGEQVESVPPEGVPYHQNIGEHRPKVNPSSND